MTVSLSDCRSNRFLAALDPRDAARWLPDLEAMEVASGLVLAEAHRRRSHAFFPLTAVLSLDHVTPEGATVEIAVVGRDGFVGVPIVLGGASTPYRATVRLPGRVLALPARCVEAGTARGGAPMRQLLRYTCAFLAQLSHTATCARQPGTPC